MSLQTRYLIALLFLALIDTVIPIPIYGAILIYVLLQKPPWFRRMVSVIYNE
jgi:hypothetical protein